MARFKPHPLRALRSAQYQRCLDLNEGEDAIKDRMFIVNFGSEQATPELIFTKRPNNYLPKLSKNQPPRGISGDG